MADPFVAKGGEEYHANKNVQFRKGKWWKPGERMVALAGEVIPLAHFDAVSSKKAQEKDEQGDQGVDTSALTFKCGVPGCSMAFASEHAVKIHQSKAHKV